MGGGQLFLALLSAAAGLVLASVVWRIPVIEQLEERPPPPNEAPTGPVTAQLKTALAAKEDEVDHYLDLLGARELVAGWTTSADVERTKPEPDLVRAAMAKAGTDEAVMVGDSVWDVEAARRAGIATVAVLTGGYSRDELADAGARQVFDSMAELRDHPEALEPGS